MPTRTGCRERLDRFRARLDGEWDAALICRREHVLYLGNFFPLPSSLNLHGSGFLLIERDGPVTLFTDNWLAGDAVEEPPHESTSADEVVAAPWYASQGPATPRVATVVDALCARLRARRVRQLRAELAFLPCAIAETVDAVADCDDVLCRMREIKDADEIPAIRRGIATAEAVHAASRELLRPGITEIDYYAGLLELATIAAGEPFVMMCDLASGSRAARGGGAPTGREIRAGELVILDFFPYVSGYRGDITNTLVAGGEPTAEQSALFDVVHDALIEAERLLRPGTPAAELWRTIDAHFREHTDGDTLVHHAGHALGLGHPEAPELVPQSERVLEEGMVLTLEPGLYGKPTGGVRLEHDYLITADGYERLSSHRLGLV